MSFASLAEENAALKALLAQSQTALAEHQAALAASEEARRRLESIVDDLRRDKEAQSDSVLPRSSRFLRQLAALPMLGGGVTLIGAPTAAAAPITDALMWSYKNWLNYEHRMLSYEMAGHDMDRRRTSSAISNTAMPAINGISNGHAPAPLARLAGRARRNRPPAPRSSCPPWDATGGVHERA